MSHFFEIVHTSTEATGGDTDGIDLAQEVVDEQTFQEESPEEGSKDINILLLGQTGAGKSTTVNTIASYFMYGHSIAVAQEAGQEFVEVIPSQFQLFDESKQAMMIVKSNPDEPNIKPGTSVTDKPVGYVFHIGNGRRLRIIDTPGIGDTKSSAEKDADTDNFEAILHFLKNFEYMNAIIIVVKGTETRNTTFFKYCISELFVHLHRSISENIIFLFTYSLTNSGEGIAAIRTYLQDELPDVDLRLEENVFKIDNQAYRNLVGKKYGYTPSMMESMVDPALWKTNADQLEALFTRIHALPPHNLAKTISLNSARKMINEMSQPMIQVQNSVAENLGKIEAAVEALKKSEITREELRAHLSFHVNDVSICPLDYPSTVCTSKDCTEVVVNEAGEAKVLYNKRCHEKCACWSVVENVPGAGWISWCKAFNFFSGQCHNCGCNCKMHMHVSCEYTKITREVINQEAVFALETNEEIITTATAMIEARQKLLEEFQAEEAIITEITSKFAYILRNDSYFTYNKYFEQYIDFLISEEYMKPEPKVEAFQQMKYTHQEKLTNLSDAIKMGVTINVTIEDVPFLRDQLLQLKHSGATFRRILETTKKVSEKSLAVHQKEVPILGTAKTYLAKLFNKGRQYFY